MQCQCDGVSSSSRSTMSSATIFHDNLLFQIMKMIKRFFRLCSRSIWKGIQTKHSRSCVRNTLARPMKFIEVKNIISHNASVSNGICTQHMLWSLSYKRLHLINYQIRMRWIVRAQKLFRFCNFMFGDRQFRDPFNGCSLKNQWTHLIVSAFLRFSVTNRHSNYLLNYENNLINRASWVQSC